MTIRKRFDEAQDLINRGLYEPALILLLVAIAAASERMRKHQTNGAKKLPGDDKRYFTKYVSIAVPVSFTDAPEKRATAADVLYLDLRCELIHEAQVKEGAFDDGSYTMSAREGRFSFGLGLLRELSKLLVSDPLGRGDFRDLLHPFQNIIEFAGPGDEGEVRTRIIADHGLTPARYAILLKIIRALTPERVAALTHDEMVNAFAEELLPQLSSAGLNEGALSGLRLAPGGPIVTDSNVLTAAGSDALRKISALYRTTDFAKP